MTPSPSAGVSKRAAALALTLLLVAAACGDDDEPTIASTTTSTAATTDSSATDTTAAPNGDFTLTLTEVARVDQPVAFAVRAGTDGFYVAEKTGFVRYLSAPNADPEQVLDISDDVSGANEQGLLGLTFSPDGSKMYVSYTNVDGDTRIEEVDPDSGDRREIFATDQPYENHNGGNIIFGPDGVLWVGLGDGGAAGDPEDRAQDPDTVLGKMLRIDPANPEPEIWAHGLRNPWRYSFDRETGDLWIGDVGQDAWEEIDFVPAGTAPGGDFGWPQAEGTHGFKDLHPPDGSVIPVYEYGREAGQSVAGGFVYRGGAIPGLVGTYLFADTYTGAVWSLQGAEHAFVDLGLAVPGGLVSSFGEDASGELYVLSLDGGVFRIDPA